ncbi:MAG: class GN sortase [Halioglobus sp.]|nr:class GN sortase [Halioglobus sp.]
MACVAGLGFLQFGYSAWIPAKAWLAQGLMQHAWLRARNGERDTRPWPWADTAPVARLSAQGGDIELIVLAGGSGRTLAFGPGHLGASVLPGDMGNSIIAGHRDTHFRFLQNIREGDELRVERADGRLLKFRVTGTDVVDSRIGSVVLDTDTATLTLITCYPFAAIEPGGPLRFVVTAELAAETPGLSAALQH